MAIDISKHILLEDDFILVLDKPCGLMVEPDRNGFPNLLQYVKAYLKTSAGPNVDVYAQHLHRLDRPVSGVILFAKQKSVLRNLSEQFAQRSVRKYYQAITSHPPSLSQGKLEHWHRKEKKKALISNDFMPYAEQVKLEYVTEEYGAGQVLWNIELHTGKFHQIRAQLATIGCPILGDALYGSMVSYKTDAIALHACKLIFHHPISGDEIEVEKKFLP
ncbi:MAG TPA: RNA pseudouridine synthase [Cytophagaceae bacterium]|jgi:23S rRNA-/tRNA-specific pseudouridylate synthase|nr:RNA pseudouridine synthase [Cytophagaceae bacterium]